MNIILHGGPAHGHAVYVPDSTDHYAIVENLEPLLFESNTPQEFIKTQTVVYWRTTLTDEEGRTVFVL